VGAGVGGTALTVRLLAGRLLHAGHWGALAAGAVAGAVSYLLLAPLLARGAVLELLDLAAGLPMVGRCAVWCTDRLRARDTIVSRRVCVLTSMHPVTDVRIYHKQALTLSRAGYDVVLLAPKNEERGTKNEEWVVLVGLPTHRLARMTVGALAMLAVAVRQRAAIYHFHDPELLPVGLVLKVLGKRVIYDVHEDYPEQVLSKHYLPRFLRRSIARLVGFGEKAIAARLDGVVCATDAIAAKFRRGRVVIVRNYPELSAVNPEPRTARSRPGIEHRFRLVHLSGTLTPERGVTGMVRALELLDDRFELVLAGRFVTPEYEAAVRTMAGFKRVRYVKPVPHKQVWGLYKECDAGLVCLLPLERYKVSLPVKMFEFMAAGLPVIASDFPLFRELVEGNGCGICVDPGKPDEIAAAVRRLACDRDLAQVMGTKGRRAIAEKYNWEQEAGRLLGLYEQVTAKTGDVPFGGLSPLSQAAEGGTRV
jgi:glycosyltransferase involved in cell wall biosynthesis